MTDQLPVADNALAVARDVLRRAPLIDGHNDLPWVIRVDRAARGDVVADDLTRVHERADTDIPRLREGMVGAQFWAAFQPTDAPHPARTALEQIDLIRRIEEAHTDVFLPARRAADYARAKSMGRIASFIAVEGGVGLENSLSPLRIWHAAGVRLMTLCHNESLDWVDSATDAPRNGGLNAFGRAVIGELNRLGIMVDVAHTSRDTMAQAAEKSRTPIVSTHSCVSALCDHSRNMTDWQLDIIRDVGGVIQITAVSAFLRPNAKPEDVTTADFADHVDYAVKRIGIDHVGISSDFDGGGWFKDWRDAGDSANITVELVRRGYDRGALEKLWGGNFLRVMRVVEAAGG
jgi:membrane dipeptidase